MSRAAPRGVPSRPPGIAGEHVMHDDRAAGLGQQNVLQADNATSRNVIFDVHFA